MSNTINDVVVEFKIEEELYGVVPEPVPAAKDIPDWYANLPFHLEDEYGKDINEPTARGCMPFFEATTRGWMLPLPVDISFRLKGDELEVNSNPIGSCDVVSFQETDIYGDNSLVENDKYPLELQTPWRADVPEDYMVWILPPLNRRQYDVYNHFEPYSGIFSAGKTFRQLGIVGLLDISNIHNVRIKSGTPIAQLVFMHRDLFAQDASVKPMSDSDLLEMRKEDNRRDVNESRYRDDVWEALGGTRNISESNSENTCPFGFGSKTE